MDRTVVVSLAEARRKRGAASRPDDTTLSSVVRDPEGLALALCRDLAAAPDGHAPWILLAGIAKRTNVPEEDLIIGAAYAHVRGWALYTSYSVMLTEDGRRFVLGGAHYDLARPGPDDDWRAFRRHCGDRQGDQDDGVEGGHGVPSRAPSCQGGSSSR